MREQAQRRPNNFALTFRGESHNLREWAEILGVPWMRLAGRLRYGWDIERIMTEPKLEPRWPVTVKHGHARDFNETPTYRSWQRMKNRCLNPNKDNYALYGGRGIQVCERWRSSFENFLADMGERPEGKTLDRYPNPDGNYEPNNCRWATPKEQTNNTRQCVILTFNGCSRNVMQWSEITGIPHGVLCQRIRYGWPVDRILNPVKFDRWHKPIPGARYLAA